MNVLWLAHAIPYPPNAGFLLRSYNLLRELARRQSVDLVAFIQEHWIATAFDSAEAGLEESRRALEEFCGTVTFLPISRLSRPWGKQLTAASALLSGSSYSTSWLVGHAARLAIQEVAHGRNYDLLHVDTIGLAPYRDIVPNVPATLTHHNIESHMMLRRAANASGSLARSYFRHEGKLLQKAERFFAPQFDTHITCSELDSSRLLEIIPTANISVIPNGVDCGYFDSKDPTIRPNSIVFVGTMSWYPNVQAMLFFLNDVWPGLKALIPSATMDIAGSNPPPSLVHFAETLPDVAVHGYLSDVRPLIDSAAVVVCPIRDGGGTKLKILDALALKKCVVAHPIACEGIGVTPGLDVILASSPDDFIRAIVTLLSDDKKRTQLGLKGRRLVEQRYSYTQIGAQFNQLLEEVGHRHARLK